MKEKFGSYKVYKATMSEPRYPDDWREAVKCAMEHGINTMIQWRANDGEVWQTLAVIGHDGCPNVLR